MKITVGDVMNARSDVRDYLSVSEENGRIYVKSEAMDVVLIDRTNEWEEALKKSEELLQKNEAQLDEANQEIKRLCKDLERLKESVKGYAFAVEVYSEMPVKEAMEQLVKYVEEGFD